MKNYVNSFFRFPYNHYKILKSAKFKKQKNIELIIQILINTIKFNQQKIIFLNLKKTFSMMK